MQNIIDYSKNKIEEYQKQLANVEQTIHDAVSGMETEVAMYRGKVQLLEEQNVALMDTVQRRNDEVVALTDDLEVIKQVQDNSGKKEKKKKK
eukprot:TRINITY_DN3887_c0_g1_i1.p5 TRINITY_DN3887_c0_g1~~TRINITY_DN3887_c0_g1_i1.p5  ORF type:complete len:104 (+),score=18.98 TRINITY_DN3887_c0_g1_i1:37-312(+)